MGQNSWPYFAHRYSDEVDSCHRDCFCHILRYVHVDLLLLLYCKGGPPECSVRSVFSVIR